MTARTMMMAAALAGSAALFAAAPATGAEATCAVPPSANPPAANDMSKEAKDAAWNSYTANVKDALGVFRNIPLYEKTAEGWARVSGKYLPLTVNGKTPGTYAPDMSSDRPMMLPLNFYPWDGYQGQSIPHGVVGRMPGSNPEVQWVFLARHYKVKDPADTGDDQAGGESYVDLRDVAAIGHHPRTGATAFFQFYDADQPKRVETIVSPWSDGGQAFWNDLFWLAQTDCAQCHSADPFMHTPWITQAQTDLRPGRAPSEAVVPGNPLGPFFYIPAEVAGTNILADWDKHLMQMDDPGNACTACHRIAQSDPMQFYANSVHGAGLETYNCAQNQTSAYASLPWMPPVSLAYGDFYADQPKDLQDWLDTYGPDAAKVTAFANGGAAAGAPPARPTPAPPPGLRSIMTDRAQSDSIAAGGMLLVVDTRMQANTDGALDAWRFVAGAAAGADMSAAPVILRRATSANAQTQFMVQFVGAPRRAKDAGPWRPLTAQGDVAIGQGDVLGLLLRNDGVTRGAALVPHSRDDWAVSPAAGPSNGDPEGILTYRLPLDRAPRADDLVTLGDPGPRTYSFEFRSRL